MKDINGMALKSDLLRHHFSCKVYHLRKKDVDKNLDTTIIMNKVKILRKKKLKKRSTIPSMSSFTVKKNMDRA